MKIDNTLNGWSTENERLYNNLTIEEQHRLNGAMILEIEKTVPLKRKSFKELYFLTLKRRPSELFTDRKVSEMQIELLQREIDRLKLMFKIS